MLIPPRIEGPDAVRRRAADRARMAEPEGEPEAGAAPRVERIDPSEKPRWNGRERRRESRRAEGRRRAWAPHAPLVAQVIATAIGMPQTRLRRRAAVAEALKAYRRPEEDDVTPHGFA